MLLQGKRWPVCYNASGARGFFGEGYAFHRPWKKIGLNYAGSCFVAKTTTLGPRAGNMPLDERYRPKELFPSCIVVKFRKGAVLNAVGLSGPGVDELIGAAGHSGWLNSPRKEPWVVSFMSVASSGPERVKEAEKFFAKLRVMSHEKIALQINLSCPNTSVDHRDEQELIREAHATLDAVRPLRELQRVPILVKLSPVATPAAGCLIAAHASCDAIVMGNTVPWGKLPEEIDWKGLFGSEVSPLTRLGGGGLSGAPLLPIVSRWLIKARALGLDKPIVAGGGVLSTLGAERLIQSGASAIELGTISILRPWRVHKVIQHVNYRLGETP
jgi:dihydroorotate dehydrogenase